MNYLATVTDFFTSFFSKRGMTSIGGGRKTVSLETVSEESALNYSAVWCATRLLCGTCASLPLPLYKGLGDEEREKARQHPLYKILNCSPNPEQTAYNFRSIMWQWQVNWGNAYAEIEREGNDPDGPVVALWPIHPARVEVRRDEGGNLFYRVKREPPYAPTEPREDDLDPWQMFHLSSILTCDGIVGHGVIEHARESIGAGIAAEKYGANWFGGAAVPRAVIEHAGNWNQETREAFRTDWEELYSGPDGHRVAVLGGGATMKPLSLSAEDSQFLETRQFGVEEVARWYGIPPHLLQHLISATFNNVEELGIAFVKYSLVPWLEIWEQVISHKLLTEAERDEYFAEHNVDALMRGNAATRAAYYKEMTGAAIMTRNQCMKLENLPPVDGGDTYLVQGAMVPLDDDGKPESKFVNGGQSTPTNSSDTEDQTDTTDPADEPAGEPADDTTDALASVAGRLHRIISHDLARFLTKEANAMVNLTKKPEEFASKVDEFYVKQATLLRDELTETFGALASCGVEADADLFIAAWATEGQSLVIEASGRAVTATELKAAVQAVIESRTWTERPIRAVENVKTAKKMAKMEAA